jgi:GWxTD domain-containing protein
MSRRGLAFSLAAIAFLLIAASPVTRAQNKQPQTPNDKDRKIKREDDRVFQEWPKRDVFLIITPDEQRAFDKLKTNEEREHFIDEFWKRRDPTPDTDENEYKDEFYERIAYANEHFSSGKPGWLTDRGRIYVKWGKPDEIESHPAGGQYQRMAYEGPGSTSVYPFERWFYRYLPGVGSGIEIEFVDPTSSGEYRIARNPFEKEAGPYSGTRDGVNGFGNPNSARHQDGPFEVVDLLNNLDSPPPIPSIPGKDGSTHSPVIEDVLSFEIKPYYFFQSEGNVVTAFAIQTDNRDLVFRDSGGLQTATLNVFGRVLTVTSRKLGAFEDTLTTTATTEEVAEAKESKSVYEKAVVLAPGKYRLDVLVRDVSSGLAGFQQFAFTVPKPETTALQISSIVLAAKLESVKGQIGGHQFTIGRNKVVPNISGVYRRGAPVGVYLQVYNAGIDQTTLRPSVDVDYLLLKDGKEISKQTEDWVGMSEAGARLTLGRLLDTNSLAAGEYEIQIRIRDHVTGQTLSPTTRFTVVP